MDHAQGLGMVKHLHVLKPLEGVGQDIPLDLGVGIVLLGVNAIGLLHHQSSRPAGLVELPEVGKQFDEQVFSTTAGGSAVGRHGAHLSLQMKIDG